MSAIDLAIEICRYLGSGDKQITQDLMQSREEIARIIERHERPERSQLSAKLAALRATVAEQARALAEARKLIALVAEEAFSTNGSEYLRIKKYVRDKCDAWISAHPAPEAEPQPRETVTLLDATLKQMIRIGNALNWNPPIDQAYADAINAIRAALQTEAEPQP